MVENWFLEYSLFNDLRNCSLRQLRAHDLSGRLKFGAVGWKVKYSKWDFFMLSTRVENPEQVK